MDWAAAGLADGSALGRWFGYALMAAGAAAAVWIPLSSYKPLSSKKLYAVLFCFMAVIVAAVQWDSGSSPPPATAAPLPALPVPQPRPVAKAARPQPPRPSAKRPVRGDDLAEPYVDQANGYSIRFPFGWIREKFDPAGPWVVDSTDGKNAIISIRFSPVPPDTTLGQLHPETLAQYIREQPRTNLEGQGRAVLGGRESLWFRYTAPLALTNTSQVMTMLHYFLPLDDGRMLELRFASTPEQFNHLGPLMRKSIGSFKLLP